MKIQGLGINIADDYVDGRRGRLAETPDSSRQISRQDWQELDSALALERRDGRKSWC